MPKTTLMFGSIGSVMETSDIQRRAYNQALREAGLKWEWSLQTYADLLKQAGGKERLAHLAAATGVELSAAQIEMIHARKTEIAGADMVRAAVPLRPGVAALLAAARARGMKTAFVTTTYRPNIDAVFGAAAGMLSAHDFDVVVSRDDVQNGKPAPDAYIKALDALGVRAADAVAVEDTALSVMAAKRAGVQVIASPGAISTDQNFWQADLVVADLAGPSGIDARVLELLE